MAMQNPFSGEGFDLVSLTEAINLLPFQPKRLGQLGLFTQRGIPTTTAVVEEKRGVLSLLPSKPRGGPANAARPEKRTIRSFVPPHIPLEDAVDAMSVQDVRVFGSEDQLQGPTKVINDKLTSMRRQHEVTEEWLRVGAIKGVILDGDGSTVLYNLFTEFGITPVSDVDFDLGNTSSPIGKIIQDMVEEIEDRLGDMEYDHIHVMCSPLFFNAFIEHPEVKYAFQYYQESRALREDMRGGFQYKGVIFESYRGKIGSTDFIDAGTAQAFPVGTPDLFVTWYAPGDFMETANTIGLPIYAKQEQKKFNRGVDLHTQSNPLPICTQPGVLVKCDDGIA